jgi:hypothetical protein
MSNTQKRTTSKALRKANHKAQLLLTLAPIKAQLDVFNKQWLAMPLASKLPCKKCGSRPLLISATVQTTPYVWQNFFSIHCLLACGNEADAPVVETLSEAIQRWDIVNISATQH